MSAPPDLLRGAAAALLVLTAAAPALRARPQNAPEPASAGESRSGTPDALPVAGVADALWADGRREDALALLEQALQASPDDLELRRKVVRRQLAVHRYAAALETTEAAPEALRRLRADALVLLGRLEDAVPLLDPGDPFQALARVEALEMLGRLDDAAAALDALEDDPLVDPVRRLVLRGRLAAARGDHAAAAVAHEDALARDPWDPGAMFGLGQALLRTARRDEGLALLERHRALVPNLDALDFARRGVDLAPRSGAAHAQVGDAERALGRTDRARAAYEHALGLATPEEVTPVVLRLARLLEEDLGEVDDAVALLDAVAAGDAGDVRLPVRAGDVLLRAGRPAEAVTRYERALAERPDDEQIERRLATARAATGGPEDGR